MMPKEEKHTLPFIEEKEKILPPDVGTGQSRDIVQERGIAEDYDPPTGKLRKIRTLIEQIKTQQPGIVKEFLGWPQGYHGIEFGDQVFLISKAPLRKTEKGDPGGGNRAFVLPQQIEGIYWKDYLLGRNPENKKPTKLDLTNKIDKGEIVGKHYYRSSPEVIRILEQIAKPTIAGVKGFTKFSSPRWSPEERARLKELYIKYRQRGIPHHIIYKAAAYLLNKSWLAVKQKLESMYGLEDELKGMKFEHWDKNKIDQTIQDLYRGGKPVSRLKLPPSLMYQITNHSMPKSESRNFPTYYNSFDDAMAGNILIIGFERDNDKLTEKPIKTLEDALKYYRRKEKMAHTWSKDEILELLCEAHTAGLPLTYSFFRSHPDIYKPLLGVGRSLEGLRDSVKRLGCAWSDLVIEAAPSYALFYDDNNKLKHSTEELRVHRFLELNNIPFRVAGDQDRLPVEDPELQILGYKHFIPDFIVLGTDGNVQAYVEVFGSIADSRAANTSELYREKKKAKEKFYSTLPYKFIAINNNTDGIDLTDEILKEKFGSFLGA
jgi:hypothetical protein